MDNLQIRQELPSDYKEVEQLIELAFQEEVYSDHKEHLLVSRLRDSEAFIPQLSLVAVLDDTIVGYILLTKVTIGDYQKALCLAPVCVLPHYQHKKIGSQLIEEAHQKAKELGYQSIIVLGHQHYYPRFGYKQLSQYNIRLPFEGIPDEFCMAIELVPNTLEHVSGIVKYANAFSE